MKHRRPSFLRPAIGIWVALAAILGWEWHRQLRAAQAARSVLADRLAERERLGRAARADPGARAEEMAAAVATAEKELAARRMELEAPEASTALPTKPLDLWFGISAANERLHALAAGAGVVIAPGEQFGFASHRREGPAQGDMGVVARQRALIERVVAALLEARPRALLSVQRERPGLSAGGDPADYFRPESGRSARNPGLVETTACRVEFTGQTAALRAFLDTLSNSRQPLMVRSVEVAPAGTEVPRGLVSSGSGEPIPVPVVPPALSRFVVTVELMYLAPVTSS